MEKLAEQAKIELLYTDEARVSVNPCIPYGWQFRDEDVFMPAAQGGGINCFALLSRNNECHFRTLRESITAEFIFEEFEQLSMRLTNLTVVVLDNAPVHTAKLIKGRREVWEQRGLYLFYLPRYSPHLNIVEILWRKLKYEWLSAKDYETDEGLYYRVWQVLGAIGNSLRINFSSFNLV